MHLERLLFSDTNLVEDESHVADETVLPDEHEGNDTLDFGDVCRASLADLESLLVGKIRANNQRELIAPDGIANLIDELVDRHVNEGALSISRVQLMQALNHDLSLALAKIVLCHEEVLSEVSLSNLLDSKIVLTKDLIGVSATYLRVVNDNELLDAR